ncbi:MAG: hypothetical protein U5K72_08095 [Balneolaceae bacterium]|nr:hypothetical protein [Balneolaceae bacterium]
MKRLKSISLISMVILLFSGLILNLNAQNNSGGFAGSFSRIGFSPRGMGMGNAMTSVTSEGSYGYYNPAFAAIESDLIQVDAGTAILPFDRRLNMVHSHFQLPPSAGLSVSLLHSRVGNIDGRDLSGYHTENLSTNEFQLTGNFGLRFSDSFRAGIGFKYNLARYHPELPTTSGLGVDLGILIKPKPKINIGITVQDLLASYRFNTSDLYGTDASDNQQFFPLRIIGGISYQMTGQWLISFDFENRRHSFDTLETEGEQSQSVNRTEKTSSSHFIRTGTSYHLHERFTLRAGMQLNNLGEENDLQPAAGFSIHLPYDTLAPSIDYAFVREPSGLSTMHVFAIRLNL